MIEFQEMKKEMRASKSEGRKGGNKLGQMKEDLNLSEDQSEKWDLILAENRSKMESIKNDEAIDDDVKRKKMKEIKGETTAQIMAILDSEQQATFKKEEEQMRQMRKQNRDGSGNGQQKGTRVE